MAPVSVTIRRPCTIAGTLPMGLMARYSGVFMSGPNALTSMRYGQPISSSIQWVIAPRDCGLV